MRGWLSGKGRDLRNAGKSRSGRRKLGLLQTTGYVQGWKEGRVVCRFSGRPLRNPVSCKGCAPILELTRMLLSVCIVLQLLHL